MIKIYQNWRSCSVEKAKALLFEKDSTIEYFPNDFLLEKLQVPKHASLLMLQSNFLGTVYFIKQTGEGFLIGKYNETKYYFELHDLLYEFPELEDKIKWPTFVCKRDAINKDILILYRTKQPTFSLTYDLSNGDYNSDQQIAPGQIKKALYFIKSYFL